MNNGTRPLNDDEISQMMSSFENPRDAFLFLLGTKTGFRISELLSLELNNLRERDGSLKGSINVSKQKMKGKGQGRTIPLSEATLRALNTYVNTLPKTQVYLFESREGNKLSRIQAWRIIHFRAQGLNFKGKIATHSMRKSFAKKIYEALDKDLVKTQRAMGHASINSTIAYLQVNMEEIDEAIRSI